MISFLPSERFSIRVITAGTIITVLFLSFYTLSSPGLFLQQQMDLCLSLLAGALVLGVLGTGLWMGVSAFIAGLVVLGLSALKGIGSFWVLSAVLTGYALVAYRIFSKLQALLTRQSRAIEELQERTNDLSASFSHHQSQKQASERKINRYETLEEFTTHLSQTVSLQEVINHTITQAIQMMHANQQTCLLYLVDRDQMELSLKGSYRFESETIKHKKGDLLDYWVFKQRQPLIAEDVQKDFRFNIEQQDIEYKRSFRSLIAVPLIDEKGIIGVLRMDSSLPNQFFQDDLRVLTIIADLATTALRNATLFAMIQELAIKDGLTGLYVYRYLIQRLQEELQRAFRSNTLVSLILMDIDWFKKYNDQFGHISGDLVLKQLGRRLLELSQAGEITARYGGEEFAIVIPGCDTKTAIAKAEKVRETVEKDIFWLRQEPTHVTLSLGVATFSTQAKDREDLIRVADQALYRAKALGRNQTCSLSQP